MSEGKTDEVTMTTGKVAAALMSVLRAYQRWVSPALPPTCRYTPTCSQYAIEALAQRGLFVGTALAAWRVLRCHPFVKGGLDPVPLARPELRIASVDEMKR